MYCENTMSVDYKDLFPSEDTQDTRVFRKLTKLAIMAILASEALLREKNPVAKFYPPVGTEPRQPLILSPTLSFLH